MSTAISQEPERQNSTTPSRIVLSASLPVYDPRYAHWLEAGGRLFVTVGVVAPMVARKRRFPQLRRGLTHVGPRAFGYDLEFRSVFKT